MAPAPASRARPRRTRYSREEVPLGAVRERDAGNGRRVRMVKVRLDGPPSGRWVQYARWWWERNRGPVPAGRRVCHADGDLLNDSPGNLVALTPGEVFNLYHKLDPAMSRRNRAACGRSAALRNAEAGAARRAAGWLPCQWYAADVERRVVHPRPRRKRWMVYHDHGFGERLAARLGARVADALAGDAEAAAWVMAQAAALREWWRWVRPASLGWPGTGCAAACALAALADAGRPLRRPELLASVRAMRGLYCWRPHVLAPGALSSAGSALGDWVTRRRGPGGAFWEIGPKALAARIPGPRIVAVRGRDLSAGGFEGFTRAAE